MQPKTTQADKKQVSYCFQMSAEVPVQCEEGFLFYADCAVRAGRLLSNGCLEFDRVHFRCVCVSHVCTKVS